jgi:hypothetical protein
MNTKTLPKVLLEAEQIWLEAVKARNYVVVFSTPNYFSKDLTAARDLLVKAQIISPPKENRILGCRPYTNSFILTAAVQKEYRIAQGATLADLAPKVREALLKHIPGDRK